MKFVKSPTTFWKDLKTLFYLGGFLKADLWTTKVIQFMMATSLTFTVPYLS